MWSRSHSSICSEKLIMKFCSMSSSQTRTNHSKIGQSKTGFAKAASKSFSFRQSFGGGARAKQKVVPLSWSRCDRFDVSISSRVSSERLQARRSSPRTDTVYADESDSRHGYYCKDQCHEQGRKHATRFNVCRLSTVV